MFRRLHPDQPEGFAFTKANEAWARAQIAKYPEGREASAIIPLLWRAQEQEGWLTRPAIETCAEMVGLARIRALEVATFYFMFHLAPVGSVAHVQVCGTTPCMLCGSEALIEVCKRRINPQAHHVSEDGKFSWEEVECLGACSNAPMVQIGKDYYEDLDAECFEKLLDAFARGEVPRPGSRKGRFASEPVTGLTSLEIRQDRRLPLNASVTLADERRDTIARITGEPPAAPPPASPAATSPSALLRDDPELGQREPQTLEGPRDGAPDDLTRLKGVGPQLQAKLNALGVFHFDQVANWSAEELAWIDERLGGFKGRAARDDWVAQARVLAEERDRKRSE